MAALESKKINYLILDRKNNYEVDERSDHQEENTYTKYLAKARTYVKHKQKIDYICEFLQDGIGRKDIEEILKKMEVIINEAREIQDNSIY